MILHVCRSSLEKEYLSAPVQGGWGRGLSRDFFMLVCVRGGGVSRGYCLFKTDSCEAYSLVLILNNHADQIQTLPLSPTEPSSSFRELCPQRNPASETGNNKSLRELSYPSRQSKRHGPPNEAAGDLYHPPAEPLSEATGLPGGRQVLRQVRPKKIHGVRAACTSWTRAGRGERDERGVLIYRTSISIHGPFQGQPHL